MRVRGNPTLAIWLLFAVNTLNFFDRQVLGAVIEPIRKEWQLSDSMIGLLITGFTIVYAIAGVPLGWLADRRDRWRLLAGGVFVWSILTAGSSFCRTFWQLFVLRLGVGIGEAICAPAASSLIGDLFPKARRAKALAIFMVGAPIGVALSYGLGGIVAAQYGWRSVFLLAGPPGILCALVLWLLVEPDRGAAEAYDIGALRRDGSPTWLVLSIPTMTWLTLSGALHNFNMYAVSSFLSPLLMRWHELDIRQAGLFSMIIFGLAGIPGHFLGGICGDLVVRRSPAGRIFVAIASSLASGTLIFFALARPPRDTMGFALLMGSGCALLYVYFSNIYSTIHDIIEPTLRGTAMAVYFVAMYVLGASFGPIATGMLSDHFTARAAEAAGLTLLDQGSLETFRGEGLLHAMYVVPALSVLTAVVLWAASRTVARDVATLQSWMSQTAAERARSALAVESDLRSAGTATGEET